MRLPVVIFTCLLLLGNSKAQKVVKVGAFNYYPAIFQDKDGSVKGFYVDALSELGRNESIRFEYVYGSWSQGLERIKKEEIDIMVSVAYSQEREKYMDYAQTPLLTVWGEVYVTPSSAIDGILNLKNRKVAVMKDDINGLHLMELTRKLSIPCTFVETPGFNEVFQLIASGEVDAGVVNNTFGASRYQEFGLRSSGIIFNPFDIFFTVKKNKNRELLKLLDKYMLSWKYDRLSVYNVARQKWSHGRVGSIEVIPGWLKNSIYAAVALMVVFVVFIVMLRYKVKKAVRIVQKTEARFRTFMENTPAYVYIKDESFKHVYSNKMVDNISNSQGEQLSSARSIFDRKTAQMLEDADRKILNGEAEQINLIYSSTIDRKKVWLHDYKFAITLPNEKRAIGGIAFDITNLKQTEAQLIAAKEKAEESDRLKTAFLQNMSHEIRTPMNAIVGFAQLLPDYFDDKAKMYHFSKIINLRCDDLLVIINDILDIAKIESGQLSMNIENCHLGKLFTELKELFAGHQQRMEKQHIQLDINLGDDLQNLIIATDKVRLKQVLINLLSNAFKFTNLGKIEAGCSFNENGELVFYVSDTGIGIPEDKHKYIFERFSQVDKGPSRFYGGTGLGLSIVKGLVELLGGRIWLQSRVGEGTTFYFTLVSKQMPIPAQEFQKSKELSSTIDISNKTILIVEDDIYNIALLKEILSAVKVKQLYAENGTVAIQKSLADLPDLILMDIGLPDMSGYDAIRVILKYKPHAKIIAQTAYASPEDRQRALKAGCTGYISKPVKPEALLELVQEHLSE